MKIGIRRYSLAMSEAIPSCRFLVAMTILVTALVLFTTLNATAQVWTEVNSINPVIGAVAAGAGEYRLNHSAFMSGLSGGSAVVELPVPGVGMARFQVEESDVLSPLFLAEYPDFRCYRGTNDFGFTCHIVTWKGGVAAAVTDTVASYSIQQTAVPDIYRATIIADKQLKCGVVMSAIAEKPAQSAVGSYGTTARVIRLALYLSDEYLSLFSVWPAAMAGAIVLVDQVSEAYERDVSVQIQVSLIRLSLSGDPFPKGSVINGELLDQVHNALKDRNDDYDLGQLLTVASTDTAGLAPQPALCDDRRRDAAASDGTTWETLAHEIGHQLNAGHTFSNCGDSPLTFPSAIEPGCGTTIMAYGGPGDHFHQISIQQINDFLNSKTCVSSFATGNTPPSVDAGPDLTVPRDTWVRLNAHGSDVDGDSLTYMWAQYDLVSLSHVPGGPLAPYVPCENPVRESSREIKSSDADGYSHLVATVRDRNRKRSTWGGTAADAMILIVKGAPFTITAPTIDIPPRSLAPLHVEWTAANSSAANVRIRVVSPGHSYTVATSTPNDGEYDGHWPCLNGKLSSEDRCELRVEPAGEVYFARTGTFTLYGQPIQFAPTLWSPADGELNQLGTGLLYWSGVARATQYDVHIQCLSGEEQLFASTAENTYQYTLPDGDYQWYVIARNACQAARSETFHFSVGAGSPCKIVELVDPQDGETCAGIGTGTGPKGTSQMLRWNAIPGATGYWVSVLDKRGCREEDLTHFAVYVTRTEYVATNLEWGRVYYWSVREDCPCAGYAACRSFETSPSLSHLGMPGLVSPSNGAQNRAVSGVLLWKEAPNAVRYRVRLGTACALVDSFEVTEPNYGYSGLKEGTSYFWRVCAIDKCGRQSRYTSCWSFTTQKITGTDRIFLSTLPKVSPGESFEIPMFIENLDRLQRVRIRLRFSDKVFQISSWTFEGTRSKDISGVVGNVKISSDEVDATLTYSPNSECNTALPAGLGAVLRLTGTIRPNAPIGPTVIDTRDGEFRRCSGTAVNPIEFDSPVEIMPPTPVVWRDLKVSAEKAGAHLTWNVNPAEDLRGFYVYRRGTAGFELLTNALLDASVRDFVDAVVTPGRSYTYQVAAIDSRGEVMSQLATVSVPVPGLSLYPAAPNPFAHRTTLSFSLSESSQVEMTIYDIAGRKVRTLLNERRSYGVHTITWDGRNGWGDAAPSGVYFCKLKVGGKVITSKVTLLK